jgi:hypothetical protein
LTLSSSGDHLLQYFGPAEDHAERVFQIVGDGPEDLALEGIGLSQPRPLRGEAAVGGGEILGTRRDTFLEPGVGALELLIENDVVEGDGQPAAENLHQRAVGAGEMTRRLEHHHDFAAAQRLDVEHRSARRELVMAAGECLLDQVPQVVLDDLGDLAADEAAVAARSGEHRERLVRVLAFTQHQNSRAVDVEQRCDLGEDPLRQPLHRLEVEQRRRRLDDDLEPAPGLNHALELLVAAQRRGQGREQLVGGELGLRLVVVDVVIDDDATLRRLARLAGAKDDAHGLVLKLLADELDQTQPGGVAFHDDVEQHHGDIGMVAHELAPLGRRICRENLKSLPVQTVVVESEAGAIVDSRLVVDHRDLPARTLLRWFVAGIVDQVDDIVFSHELCP